MISKHRIISDDSAGCSILKLCIYTSDVVRINFLQVQHFINGCCILRLLSNVAIMFRQFILSGIIYLLHHHLYCLVAQVNKLWIKVCCSQSMHNWHLSRVIIKWSTFSTSFMIVFDTTMKSLGIEISLIFRYIKNIVA